MLCVSDVCFSCDRCEVMGYRQTVFPDYHDENGTHQTRRIHGVIEKVSRCLIMKACALWSPSPFFYPAFLLPFLPFFFHLFHFIIRYLICIMAPRKENMRHILHIKDGIRHCQDPEPKLDERNLHQRLWDGAEEFLGGVSNSLEQIDS